MSLPRTHDLYSPTEYLALERAAAERHEYLDGEIYVMAGESPEHGAICTNIGGQLYNQLKGRDCQLFTKDMKVRSGPAPQRGRTQKGLYSYPDLLVICGALQFHDEHRDVLLNPTVIIEVLSPTTEAFDRGEKWVRYQTWLPALTDYVLVAQARAHLDHYHRRASSEWIYTLASRLEDELRLDSIGCVLRLADVYDRVQFPPDDADEADADETPAA